MTPRAYYNEFDEKAAAWLRELIRRGLIAPGDVDTRSIEDVRPDDLRNYTQCHFFAGIGVWSYALRRAGWPDDRPIWTGSCPCQPFSAAGEGLAFADERHLWPAFGHLIRECRPPVLTGEQVASKAADPWLDLVQDDLEAMGYAFGAVAFPSAGVGAPHIRDRTYWMAHATGERRNGRQNPARPRWRIGLETGGPAGWVADSDQYGRASGREVRSVRAEHDPEHGGAIGRLADDELQQRQDGKSGISFKYETSGRFQGSAETAGLRRNSGLVRHQEMPGAIISADTGAGPTNGYWRDADWLACRDGKWRPVEPGTFPLAHGAAARVVRLRGYGNAINAEQAKVWIEVMMDTLGIAPDLRALSGAIPETNKEKATA